MTDDDMGASVPLGASVQWVFVDLTTDMAHVATLRPTREEVEAILSEWPEEERAKGDVRCVRVRFDADA